MDENDYDERVFVNCSIHYGKQGGYYDSNDALGRIRWVIGRCENKGIVQILKDAERQILLLEEMMSATEQQLKIIKPFLFFSDWKK